MDYRNIVKNKKFHIVHTHTPLVAFLANIATRIFTQAKLIYTVHGLYSHENMNKIKYNLVFFLEFISIVLSHRVLFQSNEDYQLIQKKFPWLKKRLLYIGNGIDSASFRLNSEDREKTRSALSIESDQITFIIVARLVWEKGFMEIAEAMEKAVKVYPQLKLLIVGDGLQETEIKRQFQDLNLGDQTLFLGFRKDLDHVLAASDVFLLPSYREGVPRSVLEAMATGLPVICTDIRGCREVVVHEETGILIPARNSQKLYESMVLLIEEQELRAKMGQKGKERAEDLFQEKDVLNRQFRIFSDLIGEKSDVGI
jgi:glycosyltransferase involved in cell wall biosynthesis